MRPGHPTAKPRRDPIGSERDDAHEIELARYAQRAAQAEQELTKLRSGRWFRTGTALKELLRGPRPKALAGLAKALRPGRMPTMLEVAARTKARALLEERRYDRAKAVLDEAIERSPGDVKLRRLRARAMARMGMFNERLQERRVICALSDDEADALLLRKMEGRARELDPAWLPEIPGPPEVERVEPQQGSVLHILKHSLPYHTNGYTMRSRYTLLAQRNAGLHPAVVTSLGFPRTDGIADFELIEPVDDIPHHRLDMGANFAYDTTPTDEALSLAAWLACSVVREVRPQVIHARSGFRGYETTLIGLALAQRFDLPIVYEVSSFIEGTWSDDPEWAEVGEVYDMRVARENACMDAVDHVITIAETMRAEIVDRGIDPDRVSVIPNAVDADAFAPKDPDPDLIQRYGLQGKVVLGYISNVGQREGFDFLVEATAILRDKGLPVACMIVGDGPERPAIEALVAKHNLGGICHVTGPVPHEQVTDYYALIDVFVIPRRDDHAARWVTPLKPFEAMSMGKPLLVANLPALVEVAAPGERGLTFDVGDPHHLAARATELIENDTLRDTLGRQGRDWVLRERTWDANGRRYQELYERILERRGSGR